MSHQGHHAIDNVIRARRTNMFVDKTRVVPDEVIRELCELASWAPNHKRTWPWRFASFTGDSRAKLGETIAEAMAARGDDENKVVKARTKYQRTPNVLVLGCADGDSDERTNENRDACAAAAQNFMLAATPRGIATYWGSCPKGTHSAVASLSGFVDVSHIVGIFYVGYADQEMEVPERPAPTINWLR